MGLKHGVDNNFGKKEGLLNTQWGFFEQILKNQINEENEEWRIIMKRLKNGHVLAFV